MYLLPFLIGLDFESVADQPPPGPPLLDLDPKASNDSHPFERSSFFVNFLCSFVVKCQRKPFFIGGWGRSILILRSGLKTCIDAIIGGCTTLNPSSRDIRPVNERWHCVVMPTALTSNRLNDGDAHDYSRNNGYYSDRCISS